MTDIGYEISVSAAGTATLTCGGEVMWNSDSDDEYAQSMDALIDFEDDEQLDELIEWLVEQGYIPPDVDVDIVPEEEGL